MGISSSKPFQPSSPCTNWSFLPVLSPPWLLKPSWLMPIIWAMLAMPATLVLLPLTHMLPTELPQLPMLVLPMLPQLLHLLMPLPSLSLMPVLDSQWPVLMLFPQWDRLPRLPLSSRLLSPSSSGDTRLLTKQLIQAFKKENSKKKNTNHTIPACTGKTAETTSSRTDLYYMD